MRKMLSDGRYEFSDTPVTRSGIFAYDGASIGESIGASPGVSYNVYRPIEELAKAAGSIKGLPLVQDHPSPINKVEGKSIGGTGESVWIDGDKIKTNLFIWDGQAIDDIDGGKKQLSIAMKCRYVHDPGVTPEGVAYDYKQVDLRASHLGLVHCGRAGPDVAIMDSVGVCDGDFIFIENVSLDSEGVTMEEGALKEALSNISKTLDNIGERISGLEEWRSKEMDVVKDEEAVEMVGEEEKEEPVVVHEEAKDSAESMAESFNRANIIKERAKDIAGISLGSGLHTYEDACSKVGEFISKKFGFGATSPDAVESFLAGFGHAKESHVAVDSSMGPSESMDDVRSKIIAEFEKEYGVHIHVKGES